MERKNTMTWIVDVALILVIAVAVYIGFRKGVAKMLLAFLTVVLALAIAYFASAPLADAGYDLFVKDSVSATVDAAFETVDEQHIDRATEDLLGSDSLIGSLSRLLGLKADEALPDSAKQSVADAKAFIQNDVVRPPVVLLLRGLLFVALFLLGWVLLHLISKAVVHTADLPVIKGLNAALGAVIGLAVGVALCLGLCALFNVAADVSPGGLWGITGITRDNSVVYKFLSETFHATFRS